MSRAKVKAKSNPQTKLTTQLRNTRKHTRHKTLIVRLGRPRLRKRTLRNLRLRLLRHINRHGRLRR
jgi:hypothetical protein